MAGRFAKFYNRRGSSRGGRQPSQASILFDNIVEVGNNKRPTAAKSAGTVGRWGITSFTSLRSTNTNGGRDEGGTKKRMRVEYPAQPIPQSGQDPFSFGGGGQEPSVHQPKPAAKPRKFFKSRGAESAQKEPEIRLQASVYMNNEQYVSRGSEAQYTGRKQQQYPADKAKPSKFYSGRHRQAESSSKVELTMPVSYATRQSSGPPPPLLSDTSLQAEVKPPIRLRIFKDKGTSHLVSETQGLSGEEASAGDADEVQEDEEENYYPAHVSPDRNNSESEQEDDVNSIPPIIEDQSITAPNNLAEQAEIDEADKEKLMKAEELLTDTYVDFHATETKLLLNPKELQQQQPSKAVLANDWYSENEDDDEEGSSSETPEPTEALQSNETEILSQPEGQVHEVHSAPCSQEMSEEGSQPNEEHSFSQPEMMTQSPQKKGSIFKSRRLLTGGGSNKKRLALYKHKWSDDKEEKEKAANAAGSSQAKSTTTTSSNVFDDDFTDTDPGVLTRVTRPVESSTNVDGEEVDTVTGVLCNRAARKYYTVVRDVKNAHQMQETGEFYVFNDDVDYILDALADNNPIATRCLSAISLAAKCMVPAFRMHVRAHGIVAKFFTALHDATLDPSLALCTATVMFVMSQDQLNMDLDRASLELMLNLLDTDASHHNALDTLVEQGISGSQLDKNKRKVRELCEEIKSKGHAKHLNLDNITVGNLAMESLLSLTSRRAGEWFKEELRLLGGLEHIVKTVSVCCTALTTRHTGIWDEAYLAKLKKVDRCLRVLFNLTSKNSENTVYLLTYEGGKFMDMMFHLMQLCTLEIPLYPNHDLSDKESLGFTLQETLLSTIKLLVDLAHNSDGNALGGKMLGEKPGVVDTCLYCVMKLPNYFPEEKQFDLLVVGLCLLINLAECPVSNRKLIIEARAPPEDNDDIFCTKSAVDALIELFFKNEAIAKIEETHTDKILDSKKEEIIPKEEQASKTPDEIFNDIVEKLLEKAGKNMECNLIQAYIAMLVSYLIMENKEYENLVRSKMPDKNFQPMLKVLKKFVHFMVLTMATVSKSRNILDTERLIEYLKRIDHEHIKSEGRSENDALDMSC